MRKVTAVVILAFSFSAAARAQGTAPNEGVLPLRGQVEYVAGLPTLDHGTWCMPGIKKGQTVAGTVVLEKDRLVFTPEGTNLRMCGIQYNTIVGLSRGNTSSPGTSQSITIAAGLGSLLVGALKATTTTGTTTTMGTASASTASTQSTTSTTSSSNWTVGLTSVLAGVAVIEAIKWYRGASSANYLTISYDENAKGDLGCQAESKPSSGVSPPPLQVAGQTQQQGAGPKPSSLFYKGNVVVFKLADRHDYWNTSIALSAATGCEFVSEEAEKK